LKPGDTVVVTGAARGFGRSIAQRLARYGAKLALWDVIEEEGNLAATVCREAGAEATFFNCDMGNPDDIKTAAERVLDQFSSVHAVVNNASNKPLFLGILLHLSINLLPSGGLKG
tara:strand:+ start:254 stop:598 length:345 start_codon:yes stop_codon:yes gene_type:complete